MSLESLEALKLENENDLESYTSSFSEVFHGYNQLFLGPYEGKGTVVYRARIVKESIYQEIKELSYPPLSVVRPGRFNGSQDQIYYCATDIKTALIEVEPKINDIITVSVGEITKEVFSCIQLGEEFIDESRRDEFRNDSWIKYLYLCKESVRRVGDDTWLYLPTQLFYKAIKENKFDGVAFRSVANSGTGYNFAFKKRFVDCHVVIKKLLDFEVVDFFDKENFIVKCLSKSFMITDDGLAPREVVENCPLHNIDSRQNTMLCSKI